jgi:hypothetical protein
MLLITSVFGSTVALTGAAVAGNDAGNVSIQSPSDRAVVQSNDTMTVEFTDSGSVPESLTVNLTADGGEHVYSYTVDESQYVNDGELVSVTLDLDSEVAALTDDQYAVNVTATAANGDTRSDQTAEIVVIDDDAPGVTFGSLNETNDVAPGDDLDVTFTLSDAANVSSAAVEFRQNGTTVSNVSLGNFTPGEDGTEYTETITVPSEIADNEDYTVAVTATDESGHSAADTSAANILDVNADRPTVESVDADVNSSTVVITFSEPVVAKDGSFGTDEFTYVDNDGEGADSITSVTQTAPSEITLTVNATINASELGTDAVSVAALSVADLDGESGADDPRYAPSSTTTLSDVTKPTVSASPSDIDISNNASYTVTIDTTDEPTDVTLTVEGPEGTTVSNSSSDVVGSVTLTVDTSSLADGDVTVTAEATDTAGNTGESVTTVTRDTTRPTITSAKTNVGVSQIEVTFSEPVSGVLASSVSVDIDGVSVASVEVGADPTTATLHLTGTVPDSALDESPATVSVTAAVTDGVGNEFADDNGQTLTSGDLVDLRASADGDEITVTVATQKKLGSILGSGVTVVEQNRELVSAESFELESRFTTTLTAADFSEVESDVYQATVQVSDDDVYEIDGAGRSEQVVVDTSTPSVVDAAILDVTSDAQLDDSRNTTRIRVVFDEPVQADLLSPQYLDIEGFSGDIVAVQDAGPFGAVEILVEGDLQTGDSPSVSLTPGSFADEAGNIGMRVSTSIHTDILELSEGTNFVSVPAASGGLSVEELPTEKIDVIFRYNAETQSFESYDPDAFENDFTTLEGGKGYIIEMESDATVPVNVPNVPSGQSPPNAQQLQEGYNLVGHYQEDQQSVPVALSSVFAGESGNFTDTVFRLLKQEDGSSSYEYASYRSGEFEVMERGEAYWIFVSDDQVYTETPFGADGPQVEQPEN